MRLYLDLVGQFLIVCSVVILTFYSVVYTLDSLHILVLLLGGLVGSLTYSTIEMRNYFDFRSVYLALLSFMVIVLSSLFVYNIMFQSMQLSFLVLAAVAEEVLVRGFMLPLFARISNVYLAIISTSVIWSVYHIYTSGLDPAYFIYILLSGVIYGYVDTLTKSLTPSLLAHVLVNLTAGVIL